LPTAWKLEPCAAEQAHAAERRCEQQQARLLRPAEVLSAQQQAAHRPAEPQAALLELLQQEASQQAWAQW
jgi:hypothetical protein